MSLSQEPALSVLRDEVVCGYRDISSEPYSGFSGSHKVGGNAINTTNGAGPHNLQTFLLAGDGTVMHCLPGYWNPSDLVREVAFAARIHDLYTNPHYSSTQKKQLFQQMQMAHIDEHPASMVMRSRMQSFDQEYEAEHRLNTSDTILDRGAALGVLNKKRGNGQAGQRNQRNQGRMSASNAFKTTDRILHERMASRPFVPYSKFDVAVFSDYGRPLYDKNEDFRNARGEFIDNGRVSDKPPEAVRHKEFIGQVPDQVRRRQTRMTGESSRPASNWVRGGGSPVTSAGSKEKVLWGQSGSSKEKVLWGQH